MAGKVIKSGSRHYSTVEEIDIFNMRVGDTVRSFDIPVVAEAGSVVEPLFSEEPEESGYSPEEPVIPENHQGEVAQETVEVERNLVEEMEREILYLREVLEQRDAEMQEIKKNFRKEGYDRGRAEGFSRGMADARKENTKVLERLEQDLKDSVDSLRADSESLWDGVLTIVDESVRKIIGKNLNDDTLAVLVERIRTDNPDAAKIILRVSPDLHPAFSNISSTGVTIQRDMNMEEKSIVAELDDGVYDYSIDNQIRRVMDWLREDVNGQ